jgi:hypothetical protein
MGEKPLFSKFRGFANKSARQKKGNCIKATPYVYFVRTLPFLSSKVNPSPVLVSIESGKLSELKLNLTAAGRYT